MRFISLMLVEIKVLLQRILASYSGFSLPLHSSLCLVSEKPDYFAKMRFATHPNASFGLMRSRL
jgi:hypothetical protein